MEHAFVRNRAANEYLWNVPVPFQRLPIINEYVWLGSQVYLVEAVSHSWSGGQPVVTLDIGMAVSPQGIEPKGAGEPVIES